MKIAVVSAVVALSCCAFEASADCDTRSCSGTVRQLGLGTITAFYVNSANPGAVTNCNAVGTPSSGIFVLPATHPRYEEIFSSLQVASVTRGVVAIYTVQQTPNTQLCNIDYVDFIY